ncbi:hypothetical protein D3C87_1833990 [compost metagenome]
MASIPQKQAYFIFPDPDARLFARSVAGRKCAGRPAEFASGSVIFGGIGSRILHCQSGIGAVDHHRAVYRDI